jgi:N-acetylglucosamine-6-sulfatase
MTGVPASTMRLGALAFLLASVAGSSAAPATAGSPNIVVIMTDDQEDTGSMAYMPKTLSLIADHGVIFKNSFVNLSLCAPSRSSFLTGQAAHNHGIKANSPLDQGGWEAFRDKEDNALPVWLKVAGYRTALIGKYLNRYGQQSTYGAWLSWLGGQVNVEFTGTSVGNPRDWVPPGWDIWYAFTETRVRYYDYMINDNGSILDFDHHPSDYSTDVLRERAVRFIKDEASSRDPFFLYIAPKAAHVQGARAIPSPQYQQALNEVKLPEDPAFNEKDLRRKALKAPNLSIKSKDDLEKSYRAELQSLQSVDDLVAAVGDALKDTGKLDNTVIIYTSDNGFLFGDHRLVGKSAAYEGSLKVPLLMRGPSIPQKETREQIVNNLDVVATIVDLAGVKPGVAQDGKSVRPLFASAGAPWRSALLFESPVNRFEPKGNRYTGVRTPTKKYVKYQSGLEELFDLVADPYELNNQAQDPGHAADLAALRAVHDKLTSCVGDGCWVP